MYVACILYTIYINKKIIISAMYKVDIWIGKELKKLKKLMFKKQNYICTYIFTTSLF